MEMIQMREWMKNSKFSNYLNCAFFSGIYRLSHSLAHNDCALRMEAEFGVLLDVDEFIHIR